MKIKKEILASVFLLLHTGFISTIWALEDQDSGLMKEIELVKRNLRSLLSENTAIDAIEKSPMEHVYIVTAAGQDLFVYSKDHYIMIGDIYDSISRTNLGEQRASKKIISAIEAIAESEMIMMGEPMDRHVTVFTDTDCYYCQQFHQTVSELQANGMQVRYLMFPRSGIGSESYHEAVSVWCADNPSEAMTVAKSGGTVEKRQCDNPVEAQYTLGQGIGVRGTPTIILDNGKIIPGFLSAEKLLKEAGIVPDING